MQLVLFCLLLCMTQDMKTYTLSRWGNPLPFCSTSDQSLIKLTVSAHSYTHYQYTSPRHSLDGVSTNSSFPCFRTKRQTVPNWFQEHPTRSTFTSELGISASVDHSSVHRAAANTIDKTIKIFGGLVRMRTGKRRSINRFPRTDIRIAGLSARAETVPWRKGTHTVVVVGRPEDAVTPHSYDWNYNITGNIHFFLDECNSSRGYVRANKGK